MAEAKVYEELVESDKGIGHAVARQVFISSKTKKTKKGEPVKFPIWVRSLEVMYKTKAGMETFRFPLTARKNAEGRKIPSFGDGRNFGEDGKSKVALRPDSPDYRLTPEKMWSILAAMFGRMDADRLLGTAMTGL